MRRAQLASLIFAMLLFAQVLLSSFAYATVNIVTIASDATDGTASLATQGGQKLFLDSFGRVIAVYVDSSGRLGITYANSDPSLATSWAVPAKFAPLASQYSRPAAVLVSSTSLRIIVEGGAGPGVITDVPITILRDASSDIIGFTLGSTAILDGSGIAKHPTAILAHNGEVLAAWNWLNSTTSSRIKTLRWTPSIGWRSFTGTTGLPDDAIVDSTNRVAIFSSIIERLDNNNVYIVGNRGESSSSTTLVYNKATFDGSNWSWNVQNLAFETNAARGVSDTTTLAWDPSLSAVVGAYDITSSTKYGVFTLDSSDVKTHADTPSLLMTNNEWGSIKVDETNGNYLIFMMDTASGANNGKLAYATRSGGVWSSTLTILDAETNNVAVSIRRTGSSSPIDLLYTKSITASTAELKFVRIGQSSQTLPSALTISSSPNPATDVQGVTVSGRLTDGSTGQGLFGRTVRIERSTDQSSWTLLGQASTLSDGSYQGTFTLAAGTHYIRSSFTGDSSYSPSTSSVLTQAVTATTPNSYAVVVADDGTVYRLSGGTLSPLGQPTTQSLRDVAWRPDGSYALIVGFGATLIKYDGNQFTSISTGVSTSKNLQAVAWKPDGSYALIAGSSGLVLKYDGLVVTTIPSTVTGTLRAISWNPRGDSAVLVGSTGAMAKYENDQVVPLTSGTTSDLYAVAWNPNGLYTLVGGTNGTIFKHNGATSTFVNTSEIYDPGHIIRSISWKAENLALMSGDNGLVLTYDGLLLYRENLNGLPNATSSNLYALDWETTTATATIVGGSGVMLEYTTFLRQLTTSTSSSLRGIDWKEAVPTIDTEPPTQPQALVATATSPSNIGLSWEDSTDNVVVTGYDLFRNGIKIATVGGSVTTYSDDSVSPLTTYSYTVVAFDASQNMSPPSDSATATTPGATITVLSFTPSDDAYIRADQADGNFGSSLALEVDRRPVVKNFLLRFSITGTEPGHVENAVLWLYVTDSSNIGGEFYTTQATWSEATITWNNAPAANSGTIASLGQVSSGTWVKIEVTSIVTGDGVISLRVATTSNNEAFYSSKEGSNAPRLEVTVSNVPPVLGNIGARNVNEETALSFTATAVDPDFDTLTFSLGPGAPAGTSITSAGVFTWTPTEAQGPGIYPVTVIVTDGVLADAETFGITVGEVNKAPVLSVPGTQTVIIGQTSTITVSATDADLPANTITLSATGLISRMTFNPATGTFTFAPTAVHEGQTFQVTFTATDNGVPTLSDTKSVLFIVPINNPPFLSPIGSRTSNEQTLVSFTASATDADLPFQTLSYSLLGAPPGASVNQQSGVFTWTPSEAQGPGTFTFEVRVTDSGGKFDSETITITVSEVNQPPTVAPVPAQTVDELSTLTVTISTSDSDLPAQSLSLALTGNAAGATFDPSTGVFTWTPTEIQGPGTYSAAITAVDSLGASASITFQITVREVNMTPSLVVPGAQTVNEGSLVTLTVTAADLDVPSQTVTLSASGLPAGATFNPATGIFAWKPSEVQGPGGYTVIFTAIDNGTPSMSVSKTVLITVNEVDTAPVLASIGDKTVDEKTLLTFTATATDQDYPTQTLTFSLGSSAPRGARIDSTTGVFTWKPTESQGPGVYTITIIVSDGTFTDSETITVTVNET